MIKSITDTRKKIGRPAIGEGAPVMVRLRPEMDVRLEAWIASQPEPTTRPEAIRRLLDGALPAPKPKPKRGSK